MLLLRRRRLLSTAAGSRPPPGAASSPPAPSPPGISSTPPSPSSPTPPPPSSTGCATIASGGSWGRGIRAGATTSAATRAGSTPRSHGLKYPFMVKWLACMVISGALGADSLDILQPACLHQETLLETKEEFKMLECTFRKARIQDELTTFFTKEVYISTLARIRINAFRVELVAGSYEDLLASVAASMTCDASVGNAVYMLPSFYNHDCDPNTHIVWLENADAKLKALRDIEEGEELRICYIDVSMDVNARLPVWM